MSNERNLSKTISWAVLTNVGVDFLSKPCSHLANVTLGVVLVGLRHQKHDFWEHEGNVVLDHLHILRVSLKSVHKDPEVNTVLVSFIWVPLFVCLSIANHFLLFLSFLSEALHVLDKALFENDWLKILQSLDSLFGLKLL